MHRKVGKIRWWYFKRRLKDSQRWRIMDLCVWARNNTTVTAKSNKSCSWKKHFQADGRLFLQQNWSFGLSIVNCEWYTIISLEKFEKRTRKEESLFTMRVLAHRLQSAPLWPAKPSNWRVNRHTALTWYPMASFYFRTSRKYCMGNDFRQTPIFVKLVSSSHCKQHKWWSYVKIFWVQKMSNWLKMSNFPIKMSNIIWQH